MKCITVNASRQYDVLIGPGLLPQLGQHTKALGDAKTACIVSDAIVWSLYGKPATASLEEAGFKVISYVFPAGEDKKNGSNYLALLNTLSVYRFTRSDIIIALGGGVVGDLAGFAAATYLRGARFIQVPTTLLAAVDSSVGGKTAIDLPAGKNLAGAFWQPSLVLCDTDTLRSLPEEIFRDGCAEVIKYGILYDPELFRYLADVGVSFDREYVISRCVELKRDVVARDEYDTGARMKLNLGHTIGHGIEACSHYEISHGKAVAAGMAIVARGSHSPDAVRIVECLKRFRLPTTTEFSAEEITEHALSDKKRTGGTVRLILPRTIGCCDIVPMPVENLKRFIEEGL